MNRRIASVVMIWWFACHSDCSPAYAQVSNAEDLLTASSIAQHYFQRRLLEFVAPAYRQPLLSASLLESLSRPGPNATPDQKLAADKIAFAGSSAAQIEMQTRLMILALGQQAIHQNGMKVGGLRGTIQAGGLSAKGLVLQNKVQVLNDQLAHEHARYKYLIESRKAALAFRLENLKLRPISGLNARTGYMCNVILESIKPMLMEYGASPSHSYRDELKALTIDPADIARIQLQLEMEGPPVIFTADKGAVQLGQLPFVMNHAELIPLVRDIEARIEKISLMESGPEFYAETIALSAAIQKLDLASERVLGTAKENAKQGHEVYRLWRIAKDYRTRMRGIVKRLELEGSPKFLTTAAKQYDASQHSNGVFEFARFIVENNCKVAPAAQGAEPTYVRFLSALTQLEAILNN